MDSKITTEQAIDIYNKLEEADTNSNKDKLEEAMKETDTKEYTECEEMQSTISTMFTKEELDTMGLTAEEIEAYINSDAEKNIKESDSDYEELFNDYGITIDDAKITMRVISDYKRNNITEGLYNKLPESMQNLANGFKPLGAGSNLKISDDEAAKTVIDSFIGDAKFGRAMDEFNSEINDLMINTSKDYQMLMQDYIDNLFNDIENIRIEDPNKAKQIEDIKQAFDDSITFNKQLEFLNRINPKKIKKALNNYDSECFYFNKKVNTTDIRIPDIKELAPIIKRALPQYTEKQIKEFIIIICLSSYTLDVSNIADLAYIYRALDRVHTFRYVSNIESDAAKEVFGNISAVIQKIINL